MAARPTMVSKVVQDICSGVARSSADPIEIQRPGGRLRGVDGSPLRDDFVSFVKGEDLCQKNGDLLANLLSNFADAYLSTVSQAQRDGLSHVIREFIQKKRYSENPIILVGSASWGRATNTRPQEYQVTNAEPSHSPLFETNRVRTANLGEIGVSLLKHLEWIKEPGQAPAISTRLRRGQRNGLQVYSEKRDVLGFVDYRDESAVELLKKKGVFPAQVSANNFDGLNSQLYFDQPFFSVAVVRNPTDPIPFFNVLTVNLERASGRVTCVVDYDSGFKSRLDYDRPVAGGLAAKFKISID